MKKNVLFVQSYNPNKGNSSVITATQYALKDDDVNIEITAAVPETACRQFHVDCYDWLVSYKKIVLQKSKINKAIALMKEYISFHLAVYFNERIGTSVFSLYGFIFRKDSWKENDGLCSYNWSF